MKIPKLEELTLREKIGQTMILQLKRLKELENPRQYFTDNPIGGIWESTEAKEVFQAIETEYGNPELLGRKENMLINFENFVNECIKIPMIPAIDAAQGIPESKFENHAALPTAAGLGVTRDADLAYRYAKNLAEDARESGFRWIWSPVADNPGFYKDLRFLSSDRENNCKLLSAFIKGMRDGNIASGAKHFPGSDPYEYRDTHFCTASYSVTYEEWEKTQGKEFRACIEAGVDSIMVGHGTFKDVDDTRVNGALLPSTLSYKVVTGLIKEKLGFEGVCVTDDTSMKAFKAVYPEGQVYVECLKAGMDMIVAPTPLNYIDIIEEAVLSGELSESRIDDACRRVLKLKEKAGLFSQGKIPHVNEERMEEIANNIHQVAEEIAEKGLTLTANRTNFVPVDKNKIKKVKIVYIGYSDLCLKRIEQYMIPEFEKHGAKTDFQVGFSYEDNATLNEYDLIVYATYVGFHAPPGGQFFFGNECKMMRSIMIEGLEKSVGVSFGSPNIFFNYFTTAHTFVNCYSYNKESVEGFVRGLYGELNFTDQSPFPLNPITKTNDVY